MYNFGMYNTKEKGDIMFKKRKNYETAIKLIEDRSIKNLKSKVKILIVDDEYNDTCETLRERGYTVFYKNDMMYPIEAEPFDIILMDIKGIATRRKSNMEGFSLAIEIKDDYPLKKVCCYTGSAYKEITEKLAEKNIDAFWFKDIDIDNLCEKLDHLIQEYTDIDARWEIIRKLLVKNGICEKDIQEIYKGYMDSFNNNNFIGINGILFGVLKDVKLVMEITNSIISIINILAVK